MAKKTHTSPPTRTPSPDVNLGRAVLAMATAVDRMAEELHSLREIEALSDNTGELASNLERLATVNAMRVLAEYGTDKDREAALDLLKRDYLP